MGIIMRDPFAKEGSIRERQVFMTDFAKIALATDRVRSSKTPETWNIGGFITVSVVLGVAMVKWRVLNAVAKKPVDVTPADRQACL
jgi:hypothetical protein